jgi:choline dehydrogenase
LPAKEIIISTGAFNTPQFLKLSGIDPKDELDSFGIPVVVDLPGVEQDLQDRYEMGVVFSTTSSFEILNGCTLISASPDKCLQQ